MIATAVLEREMGFTYQEFMNILPSALRGYTYEMISADHIQVMVDTQILSIHIGKQQIRKIALLQLPYLPIRFSYLGISAADWQAFLTQFDLYYRRGGG